ncbi:CDP-diacylglycerol--glycerol-3-phosphate 3-phosphatidyltransferase 2 isoform X2 [Carya illinoinensis]|uniref:CDP-diacylglycerol--glycerol-3-phosphate 3-phosphatidyltransferase 2 isoform X2 n=1 Tax=Carya illinoinensis TaxID=32201 RepID=UPI001C71A932|nr:CDP-diacylglycerol--glycerol-3-phosphate 3-phosphatidyltransferase 2 isoform X2 [Carya illinoinensis]
MAAASIYTHKPCGCHHNLNKWARSTTATATSSLAKLKPKPRHFEALYVNCNCERIPVVTVYKHGWSIAPCAPLTPSVCDKRAPKTLRFRGVHHKNCPPALSSRSFSSEEKGGFSASKSGSGIVADMGAESKDPNDLLQSPSSMQNQRPQQQQSSKLLTLPTILTLGRVAAVPLLISNWLDGYLARKMMLGSAFGAFLDPVADKLMVAATLVLLCTRPVEVPMFGQVPWLLAAPSIAIIGREITMSAVREWAASQNSKLLEAVAVNNLGKWKTATQMTALTILLATRDSSLGGPGILVAFGVVLLYISAGLAVWSLFVYMRKIWRVLLK